MASSTLLERIAPSRPAPKRRAVPQAGSFHRVVWRWHFYAGMFVAPVLMVMSATGAIYVFEAELQEWFDRDLYYPAAASYRATAPIERQLVAAQASVPAGFRVTGFEVSDDARRATEFFVTGNGEFKRVLVDPSSAKALGEPSSAAFFAFVLRIHRTLMAGTFGRLVTELTTCWTIVLLVTGVYLWWPRHWSRPWGVWLPRLRGAKYTVLRDLHAIAGVVAVPLSAAIALSGLLYTFVWGSGYFMAVTRSAEVQVLLQTPPSTSAPDAQGLPLDEIVAVARRHSPEGSLFVQLPADPQQAIVCTFWGDGRPAEMARLVLDRSTGQVIHTLRTADLPLLAWWSRWNYPTHVGSLWGWPTKLLWFTAASILTALPMTGLWMWWQRRPRGRLGLPRRPARSLPAALWVLILGLGVALPLLGASFVLVTLLEWRLTRRTRIAAALT